MNLTPRFESLLLVGGGLGGAQLPLTVNSRCLGTLMDVVFIDLGIRQVIVIKYRLLGSMLKASIEYIQFPLNGTMNTSCDKWKGYVA